MKVTARRKLKKLKYLLFYNFIKILLRLVKLLPRKMMLRVGGFMEKTAYWCMPKTRALTIQNLNIAHKDELSKQEILRISKEVFVNLGKNAIDTFRAYYTRSADEMEQIIVTEGREHFDHALSKGKGVIALACHLGAFELIADIMTLYGYKTNIVGATLRNQKLNKLLVGYRTGKGANYYQIGEKTLSLIKALKHGEVLAVLIDQDKRKVKGTFVEFYGKPAYTPIGAAVLALKTGATVIPTAIRGLSNDQHLITFDKELPLIRTGNERADIKSNTRQYIKAIETFIRETPAQWVWMHERWKHQPGEIKDYAEQMPKKIFKEKYSSSSTN